MDRPTIRNGKLNAREPARALNSYDSRLTIWARIEEAELRSRTDPYVRLYRKVYSVEDLAKGRRVEVRY